MLTFMAATHRCLRAVVLAWGFLALSASAAPADGAGDSLEWDYGWESHSQYLERLTQEVLVLSAEAQRVEKRLLRAILLCRRDDYEDQIAMLAGIHLDLGWISSALYSSVKSYEEDLIKARAVAEGTVGAALAAHTSNIAAKDADYRKALSHWCRAREARRDVAYQRDTVPAYPTPCVPHPEAEIANAAEDLLRQLAKDADIKLSPSLPRLDALYPSEQAPPPKDGAALPDKEATEAAAAQPPQKAPPADRTVGTPPPADPYLSDIFERFLLAYELGVRATTLCDAEALDEARLQMQVERVIMAGRVKLVADKLAGFVGEPVGMRAYDQLRSDLDYAEAALARMVALEAALGNVPDPCPLRALLITRNVQSHTQGGDAGGLAINNAFEDLVVTLSLVEAEDGTWRGVGWYHVQGTQRHVTTDPAFDAAGEVAGEKRFEVVARREGDMLTFETPDRIEDITMTGPLAAHLPEGGRQTRILQPEMYVFRLDLGGLAAAPLSSDQGSHQWTYPGPPPASFTLDTQVTTHVEPVAASDLRD